MSECLKGSALVLGADADGIGQSVGNGRVECVGRFLLLSDNQGSWNIYCSKDGSVG